MIELAWIAPGYFITDDGRVFSHRQKTVAEITPVLSRDGYLKIRLQIGLRRVKKSVHRLVAEAYLERVPGKNIVRHLDDDKKNNHVSNLAWGTIKENAEDQVRNGRTIRGRRIARSHHGAANPNAKLTAEQVAEIRTQWKPGDTYAEFGRRYGVTYVTIRSILNGKLWRSEPMEIWNASRQGPQLTQVVIPRRGSE